MSTRGRFAVVAFLAVAALGVILGVAGGAQAVLPTRETWLGIDIFQARGNPTVAGRDSFLLTGNFNAPPWSIYPSASDVTLTIDDWSATIPAEWWTRKGASKQWKVKAPGFSGQIEYFVNGSSKCKYRFIASNQDLKNNWPSIPDLPVRLRIGTTFDESIIADVDPLPNGIKLSDLEPVPSLMLDAVSIKSSPKLNKDGIVVTGRLNIDHFDDAVNGFWMQFGVVTAEILPGELSITKSGKMLRFKKDLPGGEKLSFTVNTDTGKVTIALTKVEMPIVDNPMVMMFQVTNMPGAIWRARVWMSENRPKTQYKY